MFFTEAVASPSFDIDGLDCASPIKMRWKHRVPLARQALKIAADLKEINSKGKLLFPGTRSIERAISENTLNAARRMGYAHHEVCAHDFRTTASSLLNESGTFSPDAIERALDRQMRDPVRRAYARSSYWQERVEIAQRWADYLDDLKRASNGSEHAGGARSDQQLSIISCCRNFLRAKD